MYNIQYVQTAGPAAGTAWPVPAPVPNVRQK